MNSLYQRRDTSRFYTQDYRQNGDQVFDNLRKLWVDVNTKVVNKTVVFQGSKF